MKARDYMSTDVVSVGRAANVEEIASLLKKHSISGVPVVDDEKRLLGVVTHEELINIFIPHYLSMFDELAFLDDLGAIEAQTMAEIEPSLFLAEDVMVSDPVTVGPGTSIMKAAALLLNRRLVFLPVVDESGRVVARAARNKPLGPADMLVVVDDANLPLGKIRFRAQGTAGGHNGLKSVIEHLGSQAFARLRLGIGESRADDGLIDHVLGTFRPEEWPVVDRMVACATEGISRFLEAGIETAMNEYNRDPE